MKNNLVCADVKKKKKQTVFFPTIDDQRTFCAFSANLPPGLHQQSRVRDAKSHVPRPLRGDARVHIENREYGGHLRDEKDISQFPDSNRERGRLSKEEEENIKHAHSPRDTSRSSPGA